MEEESSALERSGSKVFNEDSQCNDPELGGEPAWAIMQDSSFGIGIHLLFLF